MMGGLLERTTVKYNNGVKLGAGWIRKVKVLPD